jgi:hypothetical protein
MPRKRTPVRRGVVPSPRGKRTDGQGVHTNVQGYIITPPTEILVNGVRCVNLDGSLFADAALAVLNSKPFGRSK